MKTLIISFYFLSQVAVATVNTKDSSYSDTSTDMIVPGVGYDLRILRAYNSRSIFSGLFGFGMCSDFETKLEITPEGYPKVTECGGGMEVTYTPKKADPEKVEVTIKKIMVEVKVRHKDYNEKRFAEIEAQLRDNVLLRDEMSHRLNLVGKVEQGALFYSYGRDNETVVLKGPEYVRTLTDGTFQKFNLKGQMTSMYDHNNNYLKLDWKNDQLVSVTDNNGRKLNFKYQASHKKVSEVVGPNNLRSTYSYKGEDLVQVNNAWKNTFKYTYDDNHNMIRVDFPDHTYKAMTYNTDKDWITSFRNRKGCIETYGLEPDKEDPVNHYTATVTKKCGKEVTNQSSFEYFNKNRTNGTGKYLARVRADVNGDITDVTFHEVFGKPLVSVHNKDITNYTYYDTGMVKTKKEKQRWLEFEYKDHCRKVSNVEAKYFEKDKKTPIKTVRTAFTYEDAKCNLIAAKSSEGMFVQLEYDPRGRISKIEDQSKKLVYIKYEERFGKPALVSRPGLGTIRVSYKADGEIQKVDSKEGPTVAVQVASIFNNMLDMLAPAQSETNL